MILDTVFVITNIIIFIDLIPISKVTPYIVFIILINPTVIIIIIPLSMIVTIIFIILAISPNISSLFHLLLEWGWV